jgi:hypothetical protein
MAEGSTTIISRRSTRYFTENEGIMEIGGSELRCGSSSDETEKEKPQREARASSTNIDAGMIPMVDLGKDLGGLFPKTIEELGNHGMHFLSGPFTLFWELHFKVHWLMLYSSHEKPPSSKSFFQVKSRWQTPQLWHCPPGYHIS